MESTAVATALLQLGLLLGLVFAVHAYAARHVPLETVPGVLRGRVRVANRIRPTLGATAVALTALGILLLVW